MAKADLTAARVRELLHYDPATGVFTNRAPRKKVRVGEVAGTVDGSTGYVKLRIDRRNYYGHRVAFLHATGEWPKQIVDHINGVRTDNRWTNLRDAPRVINQQNQRRAAGASASGLLGAHKKRDGWSSQIVVNGQMVKLGVFKTAEAAHDAYVRAKRELHEGCTI